MRKILRLMMLVLMVAYGTQGWGSYVLFKGKNSSGDGGSWSGSTVTGERGGITVKLTLSDGNFKSDKHKRVSTQCFVIPKYKTFTISCETAKIVYIAFSFDNGFGTYADNYSNNGWEIKEGGGGLHSTDHYSGHGDWWSQSYWEKDDNSNGVSKVSFYNGNGNGTWLLWMYVYVVKNSETTANNVSLKLTGDNRFEDAGKFTITTTSGNNVYYTTNGTTPTTSSANGKTGTTGTVSNSCIVQAATYTTYNPVSDHGSDSPKDGNTSVKKWYYSDKQVFTRYYNAPVNGPAGVNEYYGTLCYPYAVKVPNGCLAAPCVYANGATTFGTIYQAGEFIPANTPVVVYSASSGNKPFDWINTYNGESPSARPGSNSLEGNNGTSMPAEDSKTYIYYGLMEPTDNQYNRGKRFGFYLFNYQGTRGNIPAYKAYLKVKRTDVKASSKEGFSLDFGAFVNNTTGISVIPATLDGASGRQVRSAVRYNLSGQQVGPGYKGIVIVNGRKMVVK